ncbi:MAG TPA: hypothetical protein VFK33_16615 [Bacillales bacterium]|nr:hypothetical protein [Bacillales bacterium]
MLRIHLPMITVSVSVRKRKPVSIDERYEDRMRVDRLVEETRRKRDEYMRMF